MQSNAFLQYDRFALKRDLIAGLTVFIMLVPQGMAYAMLAGLPPVIGLYSSTLPLMAYALFGSSRHLSIGPVALIALMVFSGVSMYADPGTPQFISLVVLLTFMVGTIQLVLGLFKIGFIINFISHAVLSGFTSAAAVIIGLSQLKHILGIDVRNHLYVHNTIIEIIRRLEETNFWSLLIGLGSLIVIALVRKKAKNFPSAILILVVSALAVQYFNLDTQGVDIVGNVQKGLPLLMIPSFSLISVKMLLPLAVTVSFIAFMESLAVAKIIAEQDKYILEPNKDLKALGISNLVGSLISALPVTGSFSRTAINYMSGAKSQVSSVFSAVCIIITLLYFTSYFYYLPNAALAVIIILAVYRFINLKEAKRLFQIRYPDGSVWVLSFLATLFIGFKWGILIGVIYSFLFLSKGNLFPDLVELGYLDDERQKFCDIKRYPKCKAIPGTIIIRIDSSLNFVNIKFFREKVEAFLLLKPDTRNIIFDMSGVNDIDTESIDIFEEILKKLNGVREIRVMFCNMKGKVKDIVVRARWHKKFAGQIDYLSIESALNFTEKG